MARRKNLDTLPVTAEMKQQTAEQGDGRPTSVGYLPHARWNFQYSVSSGRADEIGGQHSPSGLLIELTERQSAGGYRE